MHGQPSTFTAGPWQGRTLSFTLEVAQNPAVGRKSGPKDRRPLANVPIARVRVWDHGQISGPVPVNESFIEISSLHCSIDLVAPVDASRPPELLPFASLADGPSTVSSSSSSSSTSSSFSSPRLQGSQSTSASTSIALPITRAKLVAGRLPPQAAVPLASPRRPPAAAPRARPQSRSHVAVPVSRGTRGDRVVFYESSGGPGENTELLRRDFNAEGDVYVPVRNINGNLVTPAVLLNDPEGRHGLWFIFQELSIKTEATYSLHFQLFDLESRTTHSREHAPILAECYSERLTIYAPRNHPGVPPSTKLAQHFVAQGYRLSLKKGGQPRPSTRVHGLASISPISTRRPAPKGRGGGGIGEVEAAEEEDDDDDDGLSLSPN